MDRSRIDIRAFRRSLRALERQVEFSLASETECCGVTPAQCHLLLAIEEEGEPCVGDLAVALELDASTLSRTVDKLVKAGFLVRREDPANRRRQLVSLSDGGRAKAAMINGLCDEYYGGLLSSLHDREVRAIIRAMPLFAQAMGEWRRRQAASGGRSVRASGKLCAGASR